MTDKSRIPVTPALPSIPTLWLLAFIGFSLLYIALPDLLPSGWRWLFKIMPIVLLLQLALTRTEGKVRTLLGLALVLSWPAGGVPNWVAISLGVS